MQPIGGYFELELPRPIRLLPHSEGVPVNSGYHALRLILRERKPAKVWLPDYTCDIVGKAVEAEKIPYGVYPVDRHLEISDLPDYNEDKEIVVLTNYFGLKSDYMDRMASQIGGVAVIDCCQAWGYAAPKGVAAFYSARKFVGVPDGGIAVVPGFEGELPPGESLSKCESLLARIDGGPASGYEAFKRASGMIHGEDITAMSNLTRRLISSIDFEDICRRRRENYRKLASELDAINPLSPYLDFNENAMPMVYPLVTCDKDMRRRLIEDKIFVAKYWPEFPMPLPSGSIAGELAESIIPLPIDQRYGMRDMERILESLNR